MFKIKMMIDRKEGYQTIGYYKTLEETKEMILALKVYRRPIDIYYTIVY